MPEATPWKFGCGMKSGSSSESCSQPFLTQSRTDFVCTASSSGHKAPSEVGATEQSCGHCWNVVQGSCELFLSIEKTKDIYAYGSSM